MLDKIIKKTYVSPRTRTSTRSNIYLIFHGNWSWIQSKSYLECLRLIGMQFHRVRSTLLNDKAVKLPTAKVYVFSDSVLCLGDRIAEYPRSVASWQDKIDRFTQSPQYRELDSVDGEPVVFEWNFSHDHTTLKLLQEVQSTMEENHGSIRPRVSQIQVSATKLSLFLCFPSLFMADDRTFEDAIHSSLLDSPAPLSSNVGSPYGSAPDLERTGSRSSTMDEKINEIYIQLLLFLQNASRIEIASRRFPRQWPLKLLRLQVLNKLLAASQPALPPRKQVQLPPQAVPARQDIGTYLDNQMALQPLGPLGPLWRQQKHKTQTWYFLKSWGWTCTKCPPTTVSM